LTAYETVKEKVEDHLNEDRFDQALVEIASLREAADAFFDGVMVMADDPAVRRNRLALLGHIADLFGGFADFSKLST
jgi:glycyl-tRNA synthetase beta chain